MNKTAGLTIFERAGEPKFHGFGVRIELATKVVDDQGKLKNTLCHEMCHVAAWVVHGVRKPPHGDHFKYWARTAEDKIPGLVIGTCHSYDINFKFTYECTNAACGQTFGRHSKSIDVTKMACGRCRSKLRLQPRLNKDGTPAKVREPSAYQSFVKDSFEKFKAEGRVLPRKEAMAVIAAMWRQRQQEPPGDAAAEAAGVRALDAAKTPTGGASPSGLRLGAIPFHLLQDAKRRVCGSPLPPRASVQM